MWNYYQKKEHFQEILSKMWEKNQKFANKSVKKGKTAERKKQGLNLTGCKEVYAEYSDFHYSEEKIYILS
jgi:hypothetical protein